MVTDTILYGIRYYNELAHEHRVATGRSIPHAMDAGRSLTGADFTFAPKEYGIINCRNRFTRVPELDEMGRYTPEELNEILAQYYNGGRPA